MLWAEQVPRPFGLGMEAKNKEVTMTDKFVLSIRCSSFIALFAAMLTGIFSAAGNAAAQAQQAPVPSTGSSAAKTPAMPDNAAKPAPAPQTISSGQAVYLVRSTLMMLNDANRSGNYTVLRDLAAPDFQARNSAADLAQSFLDLRRRKFDLFAVSFSSPQFSPDPSVDSSGRVRLTGFFPTRPLQINFDLTFESVDGEWRLFAISVATP